MSVNEQQLVKGVVIKAEVTLEFATILTPEALEFVAKLHRSFNGRRKELLAARQERQARLDAGETPDFLPETKEIRESDWTVVRCQPICLTAAWKLPARLTVK